MAQRLTRAESKERTRAALLKAGEDLFARVGFHAAPVEEIAEAAGFSRGAFYANFADKADLFLTIVEDERARNFDAIAKEIAAASEDEILGRFMGWMHNVLVSGPLHRAS